MNVGLPGTGLGGLFYLLTAFLMPVVEVVQTVRGRSTVERWRRVVIQAGLAAGILAGLWATAWTLQHLLRPHLVITKNLQMANQVVGRMLGVTPTVFTVMSLASLLLGVELLHFVFSWTDRR